MLQALFNQLLNQAKTKAASVAPAVLRQSVGKIDDILVRPLNKYGQRSLANPLFGSPKTFMPGASGKLLVKQQTGRITPFVSDPVSNNASKYTQSGTQRFFQEFGNLVNPTRTPTAASLRPGPGAAAFPLDNPLTRLQATGQYLTRQGTRAAQAVQNFGPTALNPFASRVPTTKLGKVGSLLNPLNPRNAAGLAIGLIPGMDEKNSAALQGAFLTPGGPATKLLTGIFMHDINNPLGPTDAEERRLIEESLRLTQANKSRLPSLDENYAKEEIEQGRLTEQFRPGGGFPGQQAPIPPTLPAPVITAPPAPGQQAGNAGAMETYMQLKQQAKTPEDYKILDQLGMAIHQEKFGTPGMRMEQTIGTFNPLMAQMGLQQPTRPIIPDQEALVDRMDQQALEAQEFLRKLTKFNKKDEK